MLVPFQARKVARSIDAFHRGFTCRSTFHIPKILNPGPFSVVIIVKLLHRETVEVKELK